MILNATFGAFELYGKFSFLLFLIQTLSFCNYEEKDGGGKKKAKS